MLLHDSLAAELVDNGMTVCGLGFWKGNGTNDTCMGDPIKVIELNIGEYQ
jgi:hypothetical protein